MPAISSGLRDDLEIGIWKLGFIKIWAYLPNDALNNPKKNAPAISRSKLWH